VPLRGAQWSRVGVRWLRDLVAAGRLPAVWSFVGGPNPGSSLSLAGTWSDFVTSVASPALLVREAELRAARGPSPKPPLYPPP